MNTYRHIGVVCMIIVSVNIVSGCKNGDNTLAPPPPGPPWVTFLRSEVSALAHKRINTFGLGVDGKVWIGTDSGASSFSGGVWGRIRDSLSYRHYRSEGGYDIVCVVNAISPGIDGSVWFGLDGGGVRRYHSGSPNKVWQTYNYPVIAFDAVTGVSADITQVGDVWVATAVYGVSRYIPSTTEPDEGTWRSYSTANVPQMPANGAICSAYDIVTNSVWFGTFNRGVFSFRVDNSGIENWSNYELPPEHNGPIVSIAFDRSQTVWLAKSSGPGAGVSSYNPVSGATHHYTNATTGGAIPLTGVKAVVTDLESTRWFGTDEGLVRLRDTTWTVFNTSNTPELPNNVINALIIDRRGNLWIGTDDGIAVFNENGTRF